MMLMGQTVRSGLFLERKSTSRIYLYLHIYAYIKTAPGMTLRDDKVCV